MAPRSSRTAGSRPAPACRSDIVPLRGHGGNMGLADAKQDKSPRKRFRAVPIPAEGENGLFTESWFPICPSFEVTPGKVVGKSFLDGRVVVYRTDDGQPHVM